MNTSGSIVAKYTYDAWGKVTAVKDASGNAITSSTHVANINPIRYRGYYYDTESSLYYLQSRYYDPEVGRFLNADSYISSEVQCIVDYNMYAYCGNDPENYTDSSGCSRLFDRTNNSKGVIAKVAETVAKVVKSIFGVSYKTTATVVKKEVSWLPDPLPIVVKTGTKLTETIASGGDSSKPISLYSTQDLESPVSSSVGVKVNVLNASVSTNFAFDNTSFNLGYSNGNTTASYSVKVNWAEQKIGLESAIAYTNGTATETTYTNASVNGWWILAAYYFISTGDCLPFGQSQPVGN